MPVDDIGDGSRAGLGIANIESREFGVGYLGCGASQCFRIATIEHHPRAMPGQCLGDCQAEPARGAVTSAMRPLREKRSVIRSSMRERRTSSRLASSSRLNLLGDAGVRRLRRADVKSGIVRIGRCRSRKKGEPRSAIARLHLVQRPWCFGCQRRKSDSPHSPTPRRPCCLFSATLSFRYLSDYRSKLRRLRHSGASG